MQSAMQENPQIVPSVARPAVASNESGDLRARQEREVEVNYSVFQKQYDELLRSHPGKFALMHNGECVEFFGKMEDALKAGRICYKNSVFSVQKIRSRPVDLGLRRPPILRGRPLPAPDAADGKE